MRLIDADALITDCQLAQKQADRHGREYADAFYSGGGEISTEWWCVEDMIENAPTIEPERKKGRWKKRIGHMSPVTNAVRWRHGTKIAACCAHYSVKNMHTTAHTAAHTWGRIVVEIKMTGKCKDCKCADLELQKIVVQDFASGDENIWEIRCIHEDACERMAQAERKTNAAN